LRLQAKKHEKNEFCGRGKRVNNGEPYPSETEKTESYYALKLYSDVYLGVKYTMQSKVIDYYDYKLWKGYRDGAILQYCCYTNRNTYVKTMVTRQNKKMETEIKKAINFFYFSPNIFI
jgi:hypothetical protein